MRRAEPALSLAPLPLSAVVGAAITTAITTPVKGVLGTTTVRLPPGKAQGLSWCYCMPTVTIRRTPHGADDRGHAKRPALSPHRFPRATPSIPHTALQARLRRRLRITCCYRLQ